MFVWSTVSILPIRVTFSPYLDIVVAQLLSFMILDLLSFCFKHELYLSHLMDMDIFMCFKAKSNTLCFH